MRSRNPRPRRVLAAVMLAVVGTQLVVLLRATSRPARALTCADDQWTARFYTGTALAGDPVGQRCDTTIDNDWSRNGPGVGGLDQNADGSVSTEMFDATRNRWLPLNQVPQTYFFWGLYPELKPMADGRLFYPGVHTFGNAPTEAGSTIYDEAGATVTDVSGLRQVNLREQGIGPVRVSGEDSRRLGSAVLSGSAVPSGAAVQSGIAATVGADWHGVVPSVPTPPRRGRPDLGVRAPVPPPSGRYR